MLPIHPVRFLALLTAFLAVGLGVWWWQMPAAPAVAASPAPPTPAPFATISTPVPLTPEQTERREAAGRKWDRNFLVAEKLLERLKSGLAGGGARQNEALLTFKTREAYQQFLGRAGAAGLRILGKMDRLQTVRVGFDSLDALQAELAGHAADYAEVDANFSAYPPEVPEVEPRIAGRFVPIGNNLLPFLGVTGDSSKWGTGVTIAILDSGVVPDATFGGRVRFLDGGYGFSPTPDNGHGTSVASLAAGASPDAMGVAPAANLLSIRVTGPDGLSDAFTIAQAVYQAVDAGAQVINVSLGAYANSYVMAEAVGYAAARGAVLVASAGNDQASALTWPAADPRVISVGAVDAAEQQVIFSNAGDQLKLTAPGYGMQTAWVNGQRVYVDGTSASAPVVSGSIAALMYQNPGLTPMQAATLLQQYASDGGPVGPDRDYGAGIVNLGWVMNRDNFGRIDTAVSSQYFDPSTLQMQFVVQNRSAQTVGGMTLHVTASAVTYDVNVPTLGPGGTFPVSVPVDYMTLKTYGRVDYRTELQNPTGFVDALPANNQRANSVTLVGPH